MGVWSRMSRLIHGWGLQSVSAAEEMSPKALLEKEVDSFNKAQADFNLGLSKQAGIVARLKAQIDKGGQDRKAMSIRIQQLLKVGGEMELAKAKQLAVQLQQTEASIKENCSQMEAAEGLYQQLTKQRDAFVKDTQIRIDTIRGKISSTEMKEASATLAKMVSGVQFSPDSSGLNALHESLDRRAAEADGAVRVAQDAVNTSVWAQTEGEQKAAEDAALEAFKASLKNT